MRCSYGAVNAIASMYRWAHAMPEGSWTHPRLAEFKHQLVQAEALDLKCGRPDHADPKLSEWLHGLEAGITPISTFRGHG